MFCQPELGKYMAGLWEQDLFRGLAWKRVEPAERIQTGYRSYIAAKAKRNLPTGACNPPVEYRAPSWSWASVNGPIEVDWRMFYSQKKGASQDMQNEIRHWESRYGPRLVSCHLLHSSDNPYIDTLERSFIEICGYYRKLWISRLKPSQEVDGPDGPLVKKVIFDNYTSENVYAYLDQPDQLDQAWKEFLIFQISKQCRDTRLVYTLLLEKVQDPDCFKRAGLVELACYNLCKIPKKDSDPKSGYFIHPIHFGYSGVKPEHYETKEWQEDRWTKGTLKLF
jgi:hypothetical protein